MIFGIPIIFIIALAVYFITTVLVTEYLKKLFKKIHPLILSWIVGILIYSGLHFLIKGVKEINFYSLIIFIVITAILNVSYKQFDWIRDLAKKFLQGKVGGSF